MNHLVAIDFDGTIAATYDPSPNEIDVNVASRRSIRKIFGDGGVLVYDQLGGLKNREPSELISLMMHVLESDEDVSDLTEKYVRAKLDQILPEISSDWPRLYPGVEDFFRRYARGEFPVDVAILSSGHDEFIAAVFEQNGLMLPNILVTSDDIRSRLMPPQRPRYKPNTFQLAIAHEEWGNPGSHHTESDGHLGRSHNKPQIMYIGDNAEKDGGLARNSRIVFGFVPFTQKGFTPSEGQFAMTDFTDLSYWLTNNRESLLGRESFAQIFLGRPDQEVFPPVAESERPFNKWLEGQRNGASKERF